MHYLVVFNVFLLIGPLTADDSAKMPIGFPEIEEDPYRKNKDERQPIYIPSMCGLNELYYPGDQADDWICDCRPAHLYHPLSDTCWPAYQKGPCAAGEHLILPKDTVIPICVKNPCNDTYVMLKGRCEMLGSVNPCSYLFPIAAAVGVNAVSLEIDCERLNVANRFGDEKTDQLAPCVPGSKRYSNGKCVKVQK